MNGKVSSSCNHENDYISRQAAIREYQEVCKGIKCSECPFLIKANTEKGSHLITDCKLEAFLHDLPSAQPETNCSEIPNNSDTIYRQDAIDAIYHHLPSVSRTRARTMLHEVPSAQPEIIRCTECKHYREYDSEYVANAVVVQCMADRYPISETIPDGWFCAGAERKDDE